MSLLTGTNGMELTVNLSEGDLRQFPFHSCLSLEEDPMQDRLDLGAYGTLVIRREVPKPVIRLRFDGAVNVEQRDVVGSARQAEPTGSTLLRFHQTRFDQGRQQASNHYGIGVDAGRDLGRRHRHSCAVRQVREDVKADGKSRVSGHLIM